MALTAERIADLIKHAPSPNEGDYNDGYVAALTDLRDALSPATEPAEDAAEEEVAERELTERLVEKWTSAMNAARKSEHHFPADCLAEAIDMLLGHPTPAEPAEEETKADPFKALHDVITFSSMDFGSASDVAWMYGIVVGWDNDDPDEGEHPHAAMWSIAQRFNWPHRKVTELRSLRAEWVRRTSSPVEEETKAVTFDEIAQSLKAIGDAESSFGFNLRFWRRIAEKLIAKYPHLASSPVVPAPTETGTNSAGLTDKYIVRRVDGSDAEGGRNFGRRYFVLSYDSDPHARAALAAYAASCETDYPKLAADLRAELNENEAAAPTETGPWQTWQEVPEGRTVRTRTGHIYTKRDGDMYIGVSAMKSHLSITADDRLAPFVAAEEEGA